MQNTRPSADDSWVFAMKEAAETSWPDYTTTVQANRFTPEHWPLLLNFLSRCAYTLKAETEQMQAAIGILDKFLSTTPLKTLSTLDLVCVLSLSLTRKFEQKESISMTTIMSLTNSHYSTAEIHLLELFIVQRLDWQLKQLTAVECLSYITEQSASTSLLNWTNLCYANYYLTRKGPFAVAICAVFCSFLEEGRVTEGKEWLRSATAQAKVSTREIEDWARTIYLSSLE